jgi:hypothetical protein
VWIQSHLGSEGATYRIGDDVSGDTNLEVIRSASFVVRDPAEGEPSHVLTAWSCDTCNFEGFAEVVFAEGRVVDIRPVDLTVEVLDRLHFVEEAINYKIELYTNHSMWDEWGVWPSWVRALRENLMRAEGALTDDVAPDDFPKHVTLDGGRYRLEEHYLGLGADQLWFARSDAKLDARYLVSVSPNNGLDLVADGRRCYALLTGCSCHASWATSTSPAPTQRRTSVGASRARTSRSCRPARRCARYVQTCARTPSTLALRSARCSNEPTQVACSMLGSAPSTSG